MLREWKSWALFLILAFAANLSGHTVAYAPDMALRGVFVFGCVLLSALAGVVSWEAINRENRAAFGRKGDE